MPATVMEGRPAPGVVRLPIPALIRVEPAAAVGVGAPSGIDHRHSGLPTQAVGRDFHPSAVGSQDGLEIGHGFRDLVNDGLGLDDGLLDRNRLLFDHNRRGRGLRDVRRFHDNLRGGCSGGGGDGFPLRLRRLVIGDRLFRRGRLLDQGIDDVGRNADVGKVDQLVRSGVKGRR